MATDVLAVTCPSCLAAPGQSCLIRGERSATHHADRTDAARIEEVQRGTCRKCGQVLYRLADPLSTFHPEGLPIDCPWHPDPITDWNSYAEWTNAGHEERHPGHDAFVQDPPPRPPAHFRPSVDVDLPTPTGTLP